MPGNLRLLLPLAAGLTLLAADTPTAESLFKHAIELQQSGDYEAAIVGYKDLLKLHPRVTDARINLGVSLAHLGRYAAAIDEYQHVLATDPKNPSALLDLALAYYKTDQLSLAIAPLTEVHELQPENAQALQLLADSELRQGKNKAVIELLEPHKVEAAANLAIAYMLGTALIRDKQPEEGQKLVELILRNGDSAEARLMIGTAKLTASDFSGALPDLQKAVELNPELPDVHGYYAAALMSTGDREGASQQFLEEIKRNPNSYDAHLQLGAALREDREYDSAMAHLSKALEARPGDAATRYQIALVLMSRQQVESARQELESIIAAAPNFVEAHVSLATAYYKLKRREDGDRERALILKMNAATQAKQPGVAQPQ